MKNWNTDVTKFKSNADKAVWELVQKIEYGLDGQPLSTNLLLKHWDQVKNQISPENRRLLEFYLWGKRYSLPIRNDFWTRPQPVK